MADADLCRAVAQAAAANAAALERARGRRWRSCVHEFVRLLRGHPLLVHLGAEAAADAVEVAMIAIHREAGRGVPPDPWRAALGAADSAGRPDDAREAFLATWAQVSPGRDLAEAAAAARCRAALAPADVFGAELAHPRRAPMRVFVALLLELDERWSNEAFPLSVEATARALSTSRQVVGRWRAECVERGLLVVSKAPVNQKSAGRYALGARLQDHAHRLPTIMQPKAPDSRRTITNVQAHDGHPPSGANGHAIRPDVPIRLERLETVAAGDASLFRKGAEPEAERSQAKGSPRGALLTFPAQAASREETIRADLEAERLREEHAAVSAWRCAFCGCSTKPAMWPPLPPEGPALFCRSGCGKRWRRRWRQREERLLAALHREVGHG